MTSPDAFAHLHVHTEFSMLDGAARVDQLVKAAVEDGQPAVAITDHGVMYGVIDFYNAAGSTRSSASRRTSPREADSTVRAGVTTSGST